MVQCWYVIAPIIQAVKTERIHLMNVFWVFVPGAVILTAGLIVFEWRNRRQQLTGAASAVEHAGEESNNQAG